MNNKMTASRSTGFNHGLVFSAKPLEEDEIFEVMDNIIVFECYDSFYSVPWEEPLFML